MREPHKTQTDSPYLSSRNEPFRPLDRDTDSAELTAAGTVLVIDDDPVVGRMIRKSLEGEVNVLQEYGLPEALAYDFETPDLIVLDYQMPIRDGLEILKEIRGVRPDVPVIFLTGFGDSELVEEALELGANQFVIKPISPILLKGLVRELAPGLISDAPVESVSNVTSIAAFGSPEARISRQFLAKLDNGESVTGNISRFAVRSVLVEFPAAAQIQAGARITDISYRFGKLALDSGSGVVSRVTELSASVSEVEVLIPEMWNVAELGSGQREAAEGDSQGRAELKRLDRVTAMEMELNMLSDPFRLAVHELAAILQEVQREAEAFEKTHPAIWKKIEDVKRETEFVDRISQCYAPYFWKAMQKFEAAAEQFESTPREHSVAKQFARKHLYPLALGSPFLARVVEKPIGVPGDFGMLGQILGNPLEGHSCYERIFNSWILRCGAAEAYRYRVDLLHREIRNAVDKAASQGRRAKILSMASGVAYEVQRFIENPTENRQVDFTLVDFSPETLEEAERQYRLLRPYPEGIHLELHRSSVIDLANSSRKAGGNLEEYYSPSESYDLVYCAGLFDYLSNRLISSVSRYLHGLVAEGGKLVLSNYTRLNPIKAWMTLVMDWELIYRTREDFETLIQSAVPRAGVDIEVDFGGAEVYALVKK